MFIVLACSIGLLAGLILLEISIRIFLVRRGEFIDQIHLTMSREYGGDVTLFDIIRAASDTARVYEMIPGANGIFVGQPLLINRDGFRDAEHAMHKQPGVKRVAILGDSVAFGWGVQQLDRFSDQLQDMLQTSNTKCEVLNFAVPGYNTVMELATFRDKVLAYEPDILLLSLVDNDDELPNFVRVRPQAWSLRHCFIVETIRDRLIGRKLGDTARFALGGIAEAGGVGHASDAVGFRPELVPPEYRFLVGEKAMRAALEQLAAEAKQRGILPVCVVHRAFEKPTADAAGSALSARLVDLAQIAGFEVIDPSPAILQYLREHHLDAKGLWVKPDDFHPSPTGHRILADQIAAALAPAIASH